MLLVFFAFAVSFKKAAFYQENIVEKSRYLYRFLGSEGAKNQKISHNSGDSGSLDPVTVENLDYNLNFQLKVRYFDI